MIYDEVSMMRNLIKRIYESGRTDEEKIDDIYALVRASARILPLKNISTGEVEWTDLDREVLFVHSTQKKVTFGKRNGEFVQVSNKDDLGELFKDCPDMIKVNKATFLNKKLIKKYNSFNQKVYFDDVVDENSISVEVNHVVSNSTLPKILGKENDLYLQQQAEKQVTSKKGWIFH